MLPGLKSGVSSPRAPQWPLWASTSTKNPAYSPTLYVDTLIGRDTVNTLAQASVDVLEAGEGDLRADTVLEGIDDARTTMSGLAAFGVDFDDVTATLEREGVAMIIDAPNSAIALGVNTLARDLNKVFVASGAGTAELTGKSCTPRRAR